MAERKMSDSTEQEDIRLGDRIPHEQVVPEAVVEGPKEGSQTTRADDQGRQRGGVRAKAEEACANTKLDPATHTSGHLGTRKTWRTIAERFYWKGLS